MKVKTIVQFNGKDVVSEDLVKIVKEELKAQGVKMISIASLDVYYKPEEATLYYVVTPKEGEEVTGSIVL